MHLIRATRETACDWCGEGIWQDEWLYRVESEAGGVQRYCAECGECLERGAQAAEGLADQQTALDDGWELIEELGGDVGEGGKK